MKFRKRPVEIEAVQFTAESVGEVQRFCPRAYYTKVPACGEIQIVQHIFVIHTLEGDLVAKEGDWIIKGVKGEFYPCKADIFAQTYELATAAMPEAPESLLRWVNAKLDTLATRDDVKRVLTELLALPDPRS